MDNPNAGNPGANLTPFQALIRTASDADLIAARKSFDDRAAELTASIKPELDKIKSRLDDMDVEARRRLNERGANNFSSSDGGMYYLKLNEQYGVESWEAFYAWIETRIRSGTKIEDVMGTMQKRLMKGFFDTWRKDNNDTLPECIKLHAERSVNFKRS